MSEIGAVFWLLNRRGPAPNGLGLRRVPGRLTRHLRSRRARRHSSRSQAPRPSAHAVNRYAATTGSSDASRKDTKCLASVNQELRDLILETLAVDIGHDGQPHGACRIRRPQQCNRRFSEVLRFWKQWIIDEGLRIAVIERK